MKLILVRHGETTWNKEERFRGRKNILLNDRGILQAKLAAEFLSRYEVDLIFSSPMQRALQTAGEIRGDRDIEIIVDEGIADMDFGQWEGMKVSEVKEKYPELFTVWISTPHMCQIPEGESFQMVLDRSLKTVGKIKKLRDVETVLVITHRVVTKLLLCHYLGLDLTRFWDIRQDSTAINMITFKNEDGYSVDLINETCHLSKLGNTV
ncbi:MAG: histidine phosphatase family protein [Actinobacteria bacterium]|nr:histidine phosphatase family protein [Actinomycetota bacterium]